MKLKNWTLALIIGVCILMIGISFIRKPQQTRPSIAQQTSPLPPTPPMVTKNTETNQPTSAPLPPKNFTNVISVNNSPFKDIPPGVFLDQLNALSPRAKKQALKNLQEMDVLPQDAESLRVDANGMIFYVCTFSLPPTAEHSDSGAALTEEITIDPFVSGAAVPISSPPIRHSRPSASCKLFLDFNGATISGTAWNSSTATFVALAYTIDGDRTTFSDTEQSAIIQIWERVSEDYAPFDVDVTTEQPASWNSQTAHALITVTTDANGAHCPHYGYGGVAYVGVFGSSNYSYNQSNGHSPAWITGNMSTANIAEAISHELGHNMGLSHDGTSAATYYSGHSNGSISWGPIMGAAYSRNISQWSKGEYYGANRTQDDLAIIAGKLTYRTDDHANSNGSATPLTIAGDGSFSDTGVIEQTSDTDRFKLVTTINGPATLSATPYIASSSTWGCNLDILLQLYTSSGSLVASANPSSTADASISTTLAPGTYYLDVKPTALGSPTSSTPTGYTIYGSLGQYTLSGTVTVTETFTFTAFALDSRVQLRWTDPALCGRQRSDVIIRAATDTHPPDSTSGRLVYSGTNQVFIDEGLTDHVTQYYSIWGTDDGINFIQPQ